GGSTQLKGISADVVLPSPWGFTETGEEYLRNPLPWSRLEPAPYSRMLDLSPIIARVSQLSKMRCADNERFQVYMSLLQRVEDMSQRDSVTLNLDQRRLINAAERELDDLQQKLMDEQSGVDAAEGLEVLTKDLVLRETLNILSDMVLLMNKGHAQRPVPPGRHVEASGDPLIDWLKGGL
ncbi:MAG: carboxy terminal-processing peptidase, partial [Verrucomicrobia bacterium]|nr:carboxy terminal-processing peptidase [Verrucomicrobiota bacterium]